MDDFPAGPASQGPRRPPLSVVIPVNNGGRDFERCLRGLRASSRTDYELIVVDDGSTDGSADLARAYGAQVVVHARPVGPAAARNAGALAASAPIVFFLDADVVPHADALARAMRRFEADPGLAALFGSYDDAPAHPGLVSQFRNLLHHFVHQRGEFVDDARRAHTFWTGCGAIRRSVFLDLGGFDPLRYPKPAIEDIELGYRMTRAGHRVLLARDVLGTHLKRWTVRGVVRTDVLCRGVPWLLLMRRVGIDESDLNVSPLQKASVAVAGLVGLALVLAPFEPGAIIAAVAGLGSILGMNHEFYRFLIRRRGWGFAAAAVPLHYLYFCCCGASVPIALTIWHLSIRGPGASRVRELPSRPHRWIRRRRSSSVGPEGLEAEAGGGTPRGTAVRRRERTPEGP